MLIDTFSRKIDYLRVSVTKNCNFRCQYCMPHTPLNHHTNDYLDLEKLANFIKIAIDNGIEKIRITGGEPLLRPDLYKLIECIYSYNQNIDIALTTNGNLLEKYAQVLFKSGLKRINVSLDSLKKERIIKISKVDSLDKILNGLYLAKDLGFKIKINMVPLKNINDDEIYEMLKFCHDNGFLLRYIEFMENINASDKIMGLKRDEMLDILSVHGKIEPFENVDSKNEKITKGPATLYKITHNDDIKIFGIISPHDEEFCKSCNRIRLTSDGILCPCLYHKDAVNIKDSILKNDKNAMIMGLKQAVFNKPEKNLWSENEISNRAFYETGG